MKNLIKTLTIAILTVAIVLTGIVIPNDTTIVSAKTTTGTITVDRDNPENSKASITMKPGNTKKFFIKNTKEQNVSRNYKWFIHSDKSIATAYVDFYDDASYENCLYIEAHAPGTITITRHTVNPNTMYYNNDAKKSDITLTVKVQFPKATAKQKKCKHKYVTTKKADCNHMGIKTCKKCKFQKSIKKTTHKYITVEKTIFTPDAVYTAFFCPFCKFSGDSKYYNTVMFCSCPKHYGSVDAAEKAAFDHIREMIRINDPNHEDADVLAIRIGDNDSCGELIDVKVTVKICKYCGDEKK